MRKRQVSSLIEGVYSRGRHMKRMKRIQEEVKAVLKKIQEEIK